MSVKMVLLPVRVVLARICWAAMQYSGESGAGRLTPVVSSARVFRGSMGPVAAPGGGARQPANRTGRTSNRARAGSFFFIPPSCHAATSSAST